MGRSAPVMGAVTAEDLISEEDAGKTFLINFIVFHNMNVLVLNAFEFLRHARNGIVFVISF